jgi:hypothetical protein
LADWYAFHPGVGLRVEGPAYARRHFLREYGPAAAEGEGAAVEIDFGSQLPDDTTVVTGRYKTVRWRVALSDPDAERLRATIALTGRPRSFALSLVQGWFVEPLVSLAAAHAGQVLLPAAAVEEAGGALLLMGASGAGKTSVSARALAAGRPVVGDDQVLLGADGRCRRLPRRLRLYHDLSDTAPDAFARLPFRARTTLRARGALDRLSRGFIRPSLAVDAAVLGRPANGPLPVQRIVVVARRHDIDDVVSAPGDSESVVSEALQLLDAQRERLPGRAGGEERAILTSAFADVPVEQLALPSAWPAGRAIGALAARLGVG